MNKIAILNYILARTREPTIVHRAIGAIGGIIAGFSLEGPAQWVALIVGVSNLIGICMSDTLPHQCRHNDVTSQLPPIDLVGRSQYSNQDCVTHRSGVDPERDDFADGMRRSMPTNGSAGMGANANYGWGDK